MTRIMNRVMDYVMPFLVLVYLVVVSWIIFQHHQLNSAKQHRCEAVDLPRFELEFSTGCWQAWCSGGELVVRRIEEPKK